MFSCVSGQLYKWCYIHQDNPDPVITHHYRADPHHRQPDTRHHNWNGHPGVGGDDGDGAESDSLYFTLHVVWPSAERSSNDPVKPWQSPSVAKIGKHPWSSCPEPRTEIFYEWIQPTANQVASVFCLGFSASILLVQRWYKWYGLERHTMNVGPHPQYRSEEK